jgi:hypothetical protein
VGARFVARRKEDIGDKIGDFVGQFTDRNLWRLVFNGGLYVGLERPDLADHK